MAANAQGGCAKPNARRGASQSGRVEAADDDDRGPGALLGRGGPGTRCPQHRRDHPLLHRRDRSRGVRSLRQPHRARGRGEAERARGRGRHGALRQRHGGRHHRALRIAQGRRSHRAHQRRVPSHAAVRAHGAGTARRRAHAGGAQRRARATRGTASGPHARHPLGVADEPVSARGGHRPSGESARRLPGRESDHRRDLRDADQPAAAGARRRSGGPLLHQVSRRPQ